MYTRVARAFLCSYLISPRRPSRPRLAGEQFDPGKLGIHTLDERIGFIWLAAVLAAPRGNDRWRAIFRQRTRNVALDSYQQMFVLAPDERAETELVFHPNDVGFVLEAPCREHLERFL